MKTVKLKYNNYDYDVRLIDSTHIDFRIPSISSLWTIPLHIRQVNDLMLIELDKLGLIKKDHLKSNNLSNGFFNLESE